MKLGLFADPHYSSAEVTCGNRYNSRSLQKIKNACARFEREKCDLIICLGDLTDSEPTHEEELATLPQLATEDIFITEHFFIFTSNYGNAIIPIKEIIWIYKYSTMHKFFWYHFSITYTLHISASKYLYLQCPKNIKSDIDGIIDYLSEANHDILVGFSEENRLKAQEIQGAPLFIEKLVNFLKKKI